MKRRADIYLFEEGYFESRERAKRAIMAGIVYQNTMRIDKASDIIKEDAHIEIKGSQLKYVSRGGLKLEKAITVWELDFNDAVILDVGASTGGFTDCSLQHGAKQVFAVDVGTNQLAWSLRSHEKVVSYEKTNFRAFEKEKLLGEVIDFVVIDVSFISLTHIFTKLIELAHANTKIIALIKPQFEAGRGLVGTKGVIKDHKIHEKVLSETIDKIQNLGFSCEGLDFSPITGGEGNIEFISIWSNKKEIKAAAYDIVEIVKKAHEMKKG